MSRPQMGVLAGNNEPRIKEVHCLHHWEPQLFWLQAHVIWPLQCIWETYTELSQGTQFQLLFDLPGWCCHKLRQWGWPPCVTACCLCDIQGIQPEAETFKVWLFQVQNHLLGSWGVVYPSKVNLIRIIPLSRDI